MSAVTDKYPGSPDYIYRSVNCKPGIASEIKRTRRWTRPVATQQETGSFVEADLRTAYQLEPRASED